MIAAVGLVLAAAPPADADDNDVAAMPTPTPKSDNRPGLSLRVKLLSH